ncbi:putative hydrolase [Oceanicola granulosus HTCC2516]|uniref:Putative hydrolase n=1 Tax=Oceanicola granulosus (strain ATCC BAA-861 / DSM 15982 / KCTC 12143 / HTCC2516) TaxID=314256 RepID=Q2CC45_OCEGH|nr:carbon-nitrogen hydrolase family protein [Oceanicola granulosus]EAR50236.1 putative hydrolase [Oceanicola granulosus HTCC2516]
MLRIALWQGAGIAGDLDATLAEVARRADEAREQGAGLLVFPEGYLTGYHVPGLAPGGLPGVEAALEQVADIAARTGLTILMGTHLDTPDGLSNAAVAFGPDGRELGRYAKRMLFGGWEKDTFRPGAAPLRFECGGLRVGVVICYDVEFPELLRAEAEAGVDLVAVPTALMEPHERISRQVVPVRAMENQVFVAYANRAGTEPDLRFVGLSRICGPRGETLTEADAAPTLLFADLDRQVLLDERAESSYLADLATARGA